MKGKSFKPLFESQPCTRCGGGGNYSYCTRYGTTCFQCGGCGWQLTTRGKSAQAFYDSLLSKPASQFVVGESYRLDGRTYRVSECGPDPYNKGLWSLVGDGMAYHPAEHAMVRMAPHKDFVDAARAQALEYQSTLTKQGKPRVSRRAA